MKIHLAWAMIVALATAWLGYYAGQKMTPSQRGSEAGQTLTVVSRALLTEKLSKGEYPPSLDRIVIPNEGGDFSAEALRHIIYRRTENGFIAFVGLRGVAYIEPDKACAFEFVP